MFGGDDNDVKRDRNGRFSRYDSSKQADRGKQAHENRLQTAVRRVRSFCGGLIPGRGGGHNGPRK